MPHLELLGPLLSESFFYRISNAWKNVEKIPRYGCIFSQFVIFFTSKKPGKLNFTYLKKTPGNLEELSFAQKKYGTYGKKSSPIITTFNTRGGSDYQLFSKCDQEVSTKKKQEKWNTIFHRFIVLLRRAQLRH
ncbi:MAG: hypothetical protein ABJQ38_18680 [Flavobacteriaceae bacterium]